MDSRMSFRSRWITSLKQIQRQCTFSMEPLAFRWGLYSFV